MLLGTELSVSGTISLPFAAYCVGKRLRSFVQISQRYKFSRHYVSDCFFRRQDTVGPLFVDASRDGLVTDRKKMLLCVRLFSSMSGLVTF